MKAFLDALTDSIYVVSPEEKILFINQAMVQHLGYEKNDVSTIDLNTIIKIQSQTSKDKIIGVSKDGNYLEGSCSFNTINLEGEKVKGCIVKWDQVVLEKSKVAVLESFIDTMNEDICIKDPEGTYVFVNENYAKRLGHPKNYVIGKKDKDFWSEMYCQQFLKDDEYVRQTGNTCIVEEEVNESGYKQYYETTKFLIEHQESQLAYVGICIRNTTVLKGLHQKVFKNPIKLKHIKEHDYTERNLNIEEDIADNFQEIIENYFNATRFNVWVYNKEKRELTPYFKNTAIDSIISPDTKISVKKSLIDQYLEGNHKSVHHISELEMPQEIVENLKKQNAIYFVTYPIIHEKEFLGVLCIAVKKYPNGQIVKNCLVETICKKFALLIKNNALCYELKNEFEQRHKIESELKAFLEISADLIVQIADDGYYEKVNSECSRVLGWSEEDLLNMNYNQCIHPDDIAQTMSRVGEYKKKGDVREPLVLVNRYRCADGNYKWLSWSIRHIKEQGITIGTAKDITYEKLLQEREAEAEKAIQLEKVRKEFFANLSHEFKTPLTIIMSVLQMMDKYIDQGMIKDEESVGLEKYLKSMRQNSYRLLRLVNNLIDVTKIDAGFYEISVKNYNIVNVVEEIVLSVVAYAKDKNIQVTFDTEVEEEIIACDADKIERIILNLLSNAIKYTEEEGEIDVDIVLEEKMVVIRIQDSGIGIPQDNLVNIFDKFMRVQDVFTRQCEGSGIGLALVKSLVEMHGGSVSVASEEGKGTTFEVRLPRVSVANEDLDQQQCIHHFESRLERCNIEFSDIYS